MKNYILNIKSWWRHGLYIKLHHTFFKHKMSGVELKHIMPDSFPYCKICGGEPSENYNFYWFYRPHIDTRNRLLKLGKYDK